MKKTLYFIIAAIIILGLYKLFTPSRPEVSGVPDSQADLIFFWGQGCPHCEKVMKFITDNKLESKVKIAYREVYNDQNNQQILSQTAKKCPEIDTSQGIGVPLGFDTHNQKCLYGDQPIIDWLSPMLK